MDMYTRLDGALAAELGKQEEDAKRARDAQADIDESLTLEAIYHLKLEEHQELLNASDASPPAGPTTGLPRERATIEPARYRGGIEGGRNLGSDGVVMGWGAHGTFIPPPLGPSGGMMPEMGSFVREGFANNNRRYGGRGTYHPRTRNLAEPVSRSHQIENNRGTGWGGSDFFPRPVESRAIIAATRRRPPQHRGTWGPRGMFIPPSTTRLVQSTTITESDSPIAVEEAPPTYSRSSSTDTEGADRVAAANITPPSTENLERTGENPNNPVDHLEGECLICMEGFQAREGGALRCGQCRAFFHVPCLQQWFQEPRNELVPALGTHRECPKCRKDLVAECESWGGLADE